MVQAYPARARQIACRHDIRFQRRTFSGRGLLGWLLINEEFHLFEYDCDCVQVVPSRHGRSGNQRKCAMFRESRLNRKGGRRHTLARVHHRCLELWLAVAGFREVGVAFFEYHNNRAVSIATEA